MSEGPETSRRGRSRASEGSGYTRPLPERAIEYWAIDINSNGAVSRSYDLKRVDEPVDETPPERRVRSRNMESIEATDIRVVFIRMQPSQKRPSRKWMLSRHRFNLWEKHRSGERITLDVPLVFDPSEEEAQELNEPTVFTKEPLVFPKGSILWEGIWTMYYQVPSSLGFNWNDDGSFEGIDCPL